MFAISTDRTVRLITSDPNYPYQYCVQYIPLSGEPDCCEIPGGSNFQEDPTNSPMIQPGYTVECSSGNRKEWLVWEVVYSTMYKPEKKTLQDFDGIILCACKCISRVPMEEATARGLGQPPDPKTVYPFQEVNGDNLDDILEPTEAVTSKTLIVTDRI